MPTDFVIVPRGPDPVKLLLERIPEFGSHLDQDDLDLPYVAFGFFSEYLLSLAVGDPIFDRAVAFLNEMAESGRPDLEDLVQVAVFESLAGDERSARVKYQLREKATKLSLAAEAEPGSNP